MPRPSRSWAIIDLWHPFGSSSAQKIATLSNLLNSIISRARARGNTGAHHDKHNLLRNVTRDEASELLIFLETFLDALYVRPARIAALRQKRSMKS